MQNAIRQQNNCRADVYRRVNENGFLYGARQFFNNNCLQSQLCAASSPYRAGEAGFSLEENKNVLDKFFQTVDYVKKFSIGGGEPLLWTSFPDFLKYLHKYSAQFGKLEIITNGTLVPKVELLEAAKLFGDQVFFLIDHYGNDISVNVSAMESLFTLTKQEEIWREILTVMAGLISAMALHCFIIPKKKLKRYFLSVRKLKK